MDFFRFSNDLHICMFIYVRLFWFNYRKFPFINRYMKGLAFRNNIHSRWHEIIPWLQPLTPMDVGTGQSQQMRGLFSATVPSGKPTNITAG